MGIELELAVLLAFSILGQSTFARFEIETPAIRNGIDPLRATPARKYYQLRGWTWPYAAE